MKKLLFCGRKTPPFVGNYSYNSHTVKPNMLLYKGRQRRLNGHVPYY